MSNEADKILIFSMVSGEIYPIERDELNNTDQYQIPLLKKPSSCKKCYGRFYVGYNLTTQYYTPCSKCARKCVDYESLATKALEIEKSKAT